jgi:hypothetical protein
MRAVVLALGGTLGLVGLGGAAFAETAWCPDLKRVIDLTFAKDKFAYIAGAPREGDFRDTTMPLAGWRDCLLYGTRTYICESTGFRTDLDAEKALATAVEEVKDCLGETWSKDEDRSSPVYAVLHGAQVPAAMTLGTDTTENGERLVRLTVFFRGR